MIYGLGMQELLVILAIVMLLFGGKKLPEVGRNLGKAIRGFKQAEDETMKELKKVADEAKTAETIPEKTSPSADVSTEADEAKAEATEDKPEPGAAQTEEESKETPDSERGDEGTGEEKTDEAKGDGAT